MAAILSSLTDLVRYLPSVSDSWPLFVAAVVALTMTLTGLTARIAEWMHDRLARGTEPVPGPHRRIV